MKDILDRLKSVFTSKVCIVLVIILVSAASVFGVVYLISDKKSSSASDTMHAQNHYISTDRGTAETRHAADGQTGQSQNGDKTSSQGGTDSITEVSETPGDADGNNVSSVSGQEGQTKPASTSPGSHGGDPKPPVQEPEQPAKPPAVRPNDPGSILAGMTLEEKVGQMFIARCPSGGAVQLAEAYQLGGYILFARDFENKSRQQVMNTISSYQQVSKVPMLIGVDEEGGTVNRVSKYSQFRSEPFMSPQELYALGGFDLIKSDTAEKCRLLKSLGINLNFAPVADVSQDPDDFIYKRTFGRDASETSRYINTVVSEMRRSGMGSVLKHFPGYGDNSDTHYGIAYDRRSYENFLTSDFLPFKAGAAAGAEVIMVAHNVVYCMDDYYPASLSANVHRILRNEIGFNGVIVTDELSMQGVLQFADDERIAVLAVKAGNDLLCCTNFEAQINAVIDAVRSGEISESRIDESVLRILKMKFSLGIAG